MATGIPSPLHPVSFVSSSFPPLIRNYLLLYLLRHFAEFVLLITELGFKSGFADSGLN
jgi:hypothetical protein